ncbi:MAG: urease accessory protein UreF [Rhodospirillaceae bacterium]|mgnify:FL=1|nr:urease accessory protein UreF [Rhodospirillaceae bacterium]|tara:strand:- start:23472 stop:24164 length:693 start_codon:yes stop_codon:yes gene_type:complete
MDGRGVLMTDTSRLLRALQMGDSAFPSGGFAFSWGLETLKAEGLVSDGPGVAAFAESQLRHRWATCDRVFLRFATEAIDLGAVCQLDHELDVMTLPKEQRDGSKRAGRSLLRAHEEIGGESVGTFRAAVAAGDAYGHLPIAQAVAWKAHGMSIVEVEAVSAFSLVSSVGQAAVRLALMGPLEAQVIICDLRAVIDSILQTSSPREPHSFAPLHDIAMMRHEFGEARLFAN